ncbi:MAG: PorV/PorQ family protein [bacterium]
MTAIIVASLLALFDFGGPGTATVPLLQVGQGARACALGESYVARAADASALHWNPAGLGRVRLYHVAFSHHEWFADIRDEIIQVTFPGEAGAFGLGLTYSSEPGIEYWSRNNLPLDTFGTWTSLVTLGYGGTIAGRLTLGANVKGLYNSLHTVVGYGGALDVGFGWRVLDGLDIGLAGRNLGLAGHGSAWRDLPAEATLGAAWTARRYSLSADVAVLPGRATVLRTGIELLPADVLALRLGYRTGPVDLAGLGWLAGISGGLGLAAGPIRLDYALSPFGALGLVHRIGLDLNLRRRGSGQLLITTVTGAELRPLSANLALDGACSGSVTTDRLGRYELTGLVPGRLVIRTSFPGYVTRVDTMHILGDRPQFATLELKPLDYGSIRVALDDAQTRQPAGGTVSYSGPVYGEQEVPANPGSVVIRDLPVGRYVLQASGPGYQPAGCTLDVLPGAVAEWPVGLARLASSGPALRAAPAPAVAPASEPVDPAQLGFAAGSADLPAGAASVLDRFVALLASRPGLVLEVAGHTDDREDPPAPLESRMDLARARAESVRRYLAERGVADERLILRGYADAQPVSDNDSEASRARNRRVELLIIDE